MSLGDVTDWMENYGKPGNVWCAKRLSGNDTLANGANQAGPYFPKEFLFRIFPFLNRANEENPDVEFDLYIESESPADYRRVRAVWYNRALHGSGTRNETRLTRFGGRQSAMLDPDSTGALAVFAFILNDKGHATECHVWICGGDGTEADLFEERLGPVEPKQFVVWTPGDLHIDLFTGAATGPAAGCRLSAAEIPPERLIKFPSGEEIIQRTLAKRPPAAMNPDMRLLRRRQCEYEMFLSVEEAVYLPRITGETFSSIDGFLSLAQTILQSRKSRSGNSLELHAREIMKEEGFVAETTFSHRPVIEGGKRPDFIFPSKAAYADSSFPDSRLRMLAAKTTCKDRWRQVINEANRVRTKHLLTLQEGVSEGQFEEMRGAGVQLVVPSGLHNSFPTSVRPHLVTLESFLGDVRLLTL